MQERQVTLGGHTYPLEEPFLVLATQNAIEQEGTYPLPLVVAPGVNSDLRAGLDRLVSGARGKPALPSIETALNGGVVPALPSVLGQVAISLRERCAV